MVQATNIYYNYIRIYGPLGKAGPTAFYSLIFTVYFSRFTVYSQRPAEDSGPYTPYT